MAILTDYRITDDTDADVAHLTVALTIDEDDNKVFTITQDGIEISTTVQMAKDLIVAIEKLV